MSQEKTVTISNDWTKQSGQLLDLVLSLPAESTTARIISTTTTTTTTENPEPEVGTNLYILPGICVNLSFTLQPIRGCKERGS